MSSQNHWYLAGASWTCRCIWLLLALLLPAGPAGAHAFLVETVPEDSTRLERAPDQVSLRFNEPVTPVRIKLVGGDGRPLVPERTWGGHSDLVRLPLPAVLPRGIYRVDYRVVSADGHPSTGYIRFGIGATVDAEATASGQTKADATALAALAVRSVHYILLLVGFGGCLFLALLTHERERYLTPLCRRLNLATLASALSAMALVGFSGAVLDGGDPGSVATIRAWMVGADSSVGVAWVLVGLAAVLATAGLQHPTDYPGRLLLIAGASVAATSFACTGHAATAPPRWLSAALVLVHAFAAMFWVGALLPLAVALRRDLSAATVTLVRRFSKVATAAVATLIVSGVGLSLLQGLDSLAAATSGDYGRVWLAKMAAVLVLLGLACFNRWVLTPALSCDRPSTFARLRISVWIELFVAAAILSLVAAFALSPPPRAAAQSQAASPEAEEIPAGYSTVASSASLSAMLTVVPAQTGRNRVELQWLEGPEASGVTARWIPPARAIASPIVAEFDSSLHAQVILPVAGTWTLQLRTADGTETLSASIPVSSIPSSSKSDRRTP